MRRLICCLLAAAWPLVAPGALHAAMYEDGRNAELPAAQTALGVYPTPMSYGAVGDGIADDTAAVQAAINAAAHSTLHLGNHIYSVGALTCGSPINIIGTQPGLVDWREDGVPAVGYSGFKVRAANQNLFNVLPGCLGSKFEDFFISMAPPSGYNTSGWAFSVPSVATFNVTYHNLSIDYACGGLDINGWYFSIDQVRLWNAGGGSGCYGIRVGHGSVGANVVGGKITNSIVRSSTVNPRLEVGMLIEDSGGIYIFQNDIMLPTFGTVIRPAANQQVVWSFFNNTVLGDTTTSAAFAIDTMAASAVVIGLTCTACWMSSTTAGPGMAIFNNGGVPADSIRGFHFNGLRALWSGHQGIQLNAGTDVTFSDAVVCGNNKLSVAPSAGVVVRNGVNGFSMRGGQVSGSCEGVAGAQDYGISFLDTGTGGTNTGAFIQGVNVAGNTVGGIAYGVGLTGQVLDNPGFNPGTSDAVVPTASPWTYTAGVTREQLCVKAGTVSSIAIGGQTFATASPACMQLGPGQQMLVTYTVAPTVARVKM